MTYDQARIRALAEPLLADSVSITDATVAIRIALAVEELDRLVLPLHPAVVQLLSQSGLGGKLAAYNTEEDVYCVYSFNLAPRARNSARERAQWLKRRVSMHDFIIGAAAHEVRHRLQFRVSHLQMWEDHHVLTGDAGIAHARACRYLRRAIDSATTLEEFIYAWHEMDAQVIELVAVSLADRLANLDDLVSVIWMEP